ncbi:MAG: efflux RND transporter permease subunit [Candidatus Margulisbacteria bacterium]|nr:efflux RND transporter permease subunit [Candidatus Margulisiibacteriota bacterium]
MICKMIEFFIKEKLIINLIVAVLLIAGFITVTNLNREAFPTVNLDMVITTTIYPGGSPDEVEKLITIPIEKKLREVNNIDKIEGFNIENVSVVVAYINDQLTKEKYKETITEIKDVIGSFSNLPSGTLAPEVEEITSEKIPAIDIAIMSDKSGDDAYRVIRDTAKKLESELLLIEGVADIDKLGYQDREFLVEISPAALKKYRVGLNTTIHKLQGRNIDMPGGSLRIGENEYILRTIGQYKTVEEVENTILFANDAGFVTKIKDIAKVKDTFEEADIFERVNNKDAIVLKLKKKQSMDLMNLNKEIIEHIEQFKENLPEDVTIAIFNDQSRFVKSRLSSLVTNATAGFLLLAVILVLLLGLRMALIVSVSIPIAFMLSFMVMSNQGISLNVISMFALVMVLGMIVDFSIVVAENTYRHLENGMERREAVTKGVAEVLSAMTVTMLCIVAAFSPLLFMTGLVGKAIYAIPMVIIICLTASWLCAVFVLPNFLDSFARVTPKQIKAKQKLKEKQSTKSTPYRRFLANMIKFRYLAVVALIALLIFSLQLAGKHMDFVFLPSAAEGIKVQVRMPLGTNLETTKKYTSVVEDIVATLASQDVESTHTRIGIEESRGMDISPKDGTHKATIIVNLTPVNDRDRSGAEIINELRQKFMKAKAEGIINKSLDVKFEEVLMGMPVGKAINVEILNDNLDVSKKIADEYFAYLKSIPGVTDIKIDLEEGKQEFRYTINEEVAAQTGLSVADVAQALLTSFKGVAATTIRKGDEEIDIRVRFPDWALRSSESLEDVVVANMYGGLIELNKVTNYTKEKGFSNINRKNYTRVVKVQANVKQEVITSLKVNRMLAAQFKGINERYPEVVINYGGEQEDTQKSMSNLGKLFLIALGVIYVLLAMFFNSLLLPVVVMICIPFSIIGVLLALVSHGMPLSFMSILGVFSLAGVIVSNTLVLVQFINNLRRDGMSLKDALVEGGALRFRPVLLTSGTTVLGLVPTIYGLGGVDMFVAPLGLAFGYGLIFATIITLLFVPCFYHMAEDLKFVVAKFLSLFGVEGRTTLIELNGIDKDKKNGCF